MHGTCARSVPDFLKMTLSREVPAKQRSWVRYGALQWHIFLVSDPAAI